MAGIRRFGFGGSGWPRRLFAWRARRPSAAASRLALPARPDGLSPRRLVEQRRPAAARRGRPSPTRRPSPARRLPLATLLLTLALAPFLLWPSGPPSLYSLWSPALGLQVPTCESSRVLTLRVPPLRGDDVTELQMTLRQLSIYEGPIDGVFSPETAAAVTATRMKCGLSPIARVDTAFWEAVGADWLAANAQVRSAAAATPGAAAPPAPPEGDLLIVINIETVRLTLYAGGYPYKSYPVAIGRPGSPSPVGQWRVRNKGINVGPPFGTRWMGLSVPWGIYGVHGTNNPGSIGSMASGGCIRMFNWNVEELYEWVEVGTPVHIISPHWTASVRPSLPEGAVGLSVVFLQWQMQRLGWNAGDADGRLGGQTVEVIRDLESFYGLPVDGVADTDVLSLLDLGR